MLNPLRLSFTLVFGAPLAITTACSDANLTNVGSIVEDGGAIDAAPMPDSASALDATTPDSTASSDAASSDAEADARIDAQPDGNLPCPAGPCGAKVCGRDACGQVCGTCPSPGAQGGCFMGACIVDSPGSQCPGTPCIDQNGEQICEGERGGVACTGGTIGIMVCTCTGAGPTAWTSCGACL